jgi:hypothetical protein
MPNLTGAADAALDAGAAEDAATLDAADDEATLDEADDAAGALVAGTAVAVGAGGMVGGTAAVGSADDVVAGAGAGAQATIRTNIATNATNKTNLRICFFSSEKLKSWSSWITSQWIFLSNHLLVQ